MRTEQRGARALGISLAAAVSVLTLWPSSATAHLPAGSYYPLGVALLVLLIGIARARKRLAAPPFVGALVGFYVIVTVSTLAFAEVNPFSLLIGPVALSAYWAASSATSAEQRAVVRVVVLLAAAQAVLAVGEVFLRTGVLLGTPFTLSPDNPFIAGAPRAQGTLAHPLALSFLFIVGLGLVCAKKSRPAARMGLIAVFLLGAFLTGSSSAVVIAAVIILLWFLNRGTWPGRTFAYITAAAALLVVVGTGVTATILEQEFDERNAGHRLNSIMAIPSLLFGRDAPSALIGSGYEVRSLYTSGIFFNDGFFTIDNQFVSFLAQGGNIGLALIGYALLRLTFRSSRRYLPGWIGMLAMGLSFDFMSWYVPAALTLVYAALAARPRVTPETDPSRPSPSHRGQYGATSPRRLAERSASR